MKPIILMSTIVLATATPLLAAERTYDFNAFTKVVVRGGVDVRINSGGAHKVVADVSRRSLLRKLDVRQVGDTLIIERRGPPSFFLMGMADRYEVTVSLPELAEVAAVAGADVDVGGATIRPFAARASSGADLHLRDISAQTVSLISSSGADLTASGECTDLTAKVSSGADLVAADLVCNTVALRASSGGDLSAHATESASARATSGGGIRLHGKAASRDLSESSGGDVHYSG